MTSHTDNDLRTVAEKVRTGQRLSLEDGLLLSHTRDIHTVGELANHVREKRHGRTTYYNVNRHINYTNYCVLRCKFCSFYRRFPQHAHDAPGPASADDPSARRNDAYDLSVDDIVSRAKEAYSAGATEVHIVGGLHPTRPYEYYLDMCRDIRRACPNMHIKAFTAIEIIHFTRISRPRRTIRQVLIELREAGLGSLPGGGAEIFDERVHAEAFKNKMGETGWFDVHRTAHELGIFTNATMLYGHVETPAERIRHLIKLRDHQDASIADRPAYFNCIVPLSFVPQNSELAHLPGPTGLTDLRTLAITRLMLDNFAHVKAFWVMHSPKLAQVSLNWGVDDLDGTVVYYDITKRTGSNSVQQGLSVEQITRLIVEAGGIPVERDTLYRPVTRPEAASCPEKPASRS